MEKGIKTFKVYGLITEYIVLKCPECKKMYRYDFIPKRFGKEIIICNFKNPLVSREQLSLKLGAIR